MPVIHGVPSSRTRMCQQWNHSRTHSPRKRNISSLFVSLSSDYSFLPLKAFLESNGTFWNINYEQETGAMSRPIGIRG